MRELKIEKSFTDRHQDSLQRYLRELNQYPLLTDKEETILAQKIQKGDQAAVDQLITSNLRFVVSVAKKYVGQGLALSDLISEGNIGLAKAARLFDQTKGFRFLSYAVWWIRQSIMGAIVRYGRIVRLPYSQVNGIMTVIKTEEKLEQKFERLPSPEEIAEQADIDLERCVDFKFSSGTALSLDATKEGNPTDACSTILSVLADPTYAKPDHALDIEDLKQDLNLLLDILSARQRNIINLGFGLNGAEPIQNEDVALRLGLSTETIRRDRYNALCDMRKAKGIHILEQYSF